MALQDELNPEYLANEIATLMSQRMQSMNLPDTEMQSNAQILFEFGKIASSLVLQEPGFDNPTTGETIPFDYAMAKQVVELFSEGIFQAALSCSQKGLPFELKSQFLQQLAQDLYAQSKQIAVSTYGQDATPEMQIPKDQQVQWIAQNAESGLNYIISEYERQNGPLQGNQGMPQMTMPDMPDMTPPPMNMDSPEGETALGGIDLDEMNLGQSTNLGNLPTAIESIPPIPPPQKPTGPHPHDKYAAISLLINTLPETTTKQLLKRFNQDELQIIYRYINPKTIEETLDLSQVTRHLKSFKSLLKEGAPQLKTEAFEKFEALSQVVNRHAVLAQIQYDRQKIDAYLQIHFPAEEDPEEVLLTYLWQNPATKKKKAKKLPFNAVLPPKIEAILYDYLAAKCHYSGLPGSGGAT
jgi:hypothetical protein